MSFHTIGKPSDHYHESHAHHHADRASDGVELAPGIHFGRRMFDLDAFEIAARMDKADQLGDDPDDVPARVYREDLTDEELAARIDRGDIEDP